MPTPAIHTMGGALAYLATGDLSIGRIYIVVGVLVISSLPDFDFIIPGPHRAFSHSLVFCIIATAIIGYFTKFTYLSVGAMLLSHLLLDSLANGWYSVSWLWPWYVHKSPVSYGWDNIGEFIRHALRIF